MVAMPFLATAPMTIEAAQYMYLNDHEYRLAYAYLNDKSVRTFYGLS